MMSEWKKWANEWIVSELKCPFTCIAHSIRHSTATNGTVSVKIKLWELFSHGHLPELNRITYRAGETHTENDQSAWNLMSSTDLFGLSCNLHRVQITRLQKLRNACSLGQLEKSSFAEPTWRHDHAIEHNDTGVVNHTGKHSNLLVNKAVYISAAAK